MGCQRSSAAFTAVRRCRGQVREPVSSQSPLYALDIEIWAFNAELRDARGEFWIDADP